MRKDECVSVVGLGYVGLPLAVSFAGKFRVVGFDINETRLGELKAGHDRTGEVSVEELKASAIKFTNSHSDLREATMHIITVPTPVDAAHRPDLRALLS